MTIEVGEVGASQKTLFEELGGAEKIRDLVEKFYDIMDSDPKVTGIRAMHSADLTEAREKLFMFLTGWSGVLRFISSAMATRCFVSAICHLPLVSPSVTSGCFAWCVLCTRLRWKNRWSCDWLRRFGLLRISCGTSPRTKLPKLK